MLVLTVSAREDELERWTTLIEHYEAIHHPINPHPINPPDPIEAIKFCMAQKELLAKEFTS